MRALVAGWFSFERMGATAGDLLARDVVCSWLGEHAIDYDVAVAEPFGGGVDWRDVDPRRYSHVVFVCGPFGNGWPLTEFLPRFAASKLVGVDVSLLEPLDVWNPFDQLLERDSSRTARPDLSFLSNQPPASVVGLVLVHPQKEYEGGLNEEVQAIVEDVLGHRDVAVVRIDTRLDVNAGGLRTPAQVESLIARMDAVLTTRLHGLVLGLKNGVPVAAIDPIRGGAKVRRQAETIDWPIVLAAEELSADRLAEALDYCLTGEARSRAASCRDRARALLAGARQAFLAGFADGPAA